MLACSFVGRNESFHTNRLFNTYTSELNRIEFDSLECWCSSGFIWRLFQVYKSCILLNSIFVLFHVGLSSSSFAFVPWAPINCALIRVHGISDVSHVRQPNISTFSSTFASSFCCLMLGFCVCFSFYSLTIFVIFFIMSWTLHCHNVIVSHFLFDILCSIFLRNSNFSCTFAIEPYFLSTLRQKLIHLNRYFSKLNVFVYKLTHILCLIQYLAIIFIVISKWKRMDAFEWWMYCIFVWVRLKETNWS